MKTSLPFGILFIVALLFANSNANAAFIPTVNNIGLQQAGDNNSALVQETSIGKGFYNYVVTGALDKWTQISVTYTATNISHGGVVSGYATAYAPQKPSIIAALPTLAIVGPITGNMMTSTSVIKNLSNDVMTFGAYFVSVVMCRCVNITISYATSSVPLPSAALLFVPGVLGLAGFSRWRKQRFS